MCQDLEAGEDCLGPVREGESMVRKEGTCSCGVIVKAAALLLNGYCNVILIIPLSNQGRGREGTLTERLAQVRPPRISWWTKAGVRF